MRLLNRCDWLKDKLNLKIGRKTERGIGKEIGLAFIWQNQSVYNNNVIINAVNETCSIAKKT
jgi:hypothetical protein